MCCTTHVVQACSFRLSVTTLICLNQLLKLLVKFTDFPCKHQWNCLLWLKSMLRLRLTKSWQILLCVVLLLSCHGLLLVETELMNEAETAVNGWTHSFLELLRQSVHSWWLPPKLSQHIVLVERAQQLPIVPNSRPSTATKVLMK